MSESANVGRYALALMEHLKNNPAYTIPDMTDLAGKEMLNGDPDRASAMFKKIQAYSELIQMNLARDTKLRHHRAAAGFGAVGAGVAGVGAGLAAADPARLAALLAAEVAAVVAVETQAGLPVR